MKLFTGACTALITPFKNGEVDYGCLERLIEMQISAGISALVLCGTTGEAATLSEDEKSEIIGFCASKIGGRVPLIAGCSSPSSEYAARLAKNAQKKGADAILTTTPYYNKCTPEGLYLHYKSVAEADLPLIAYNVPSRTGMNILPSHYERLSEIDCLVAIKEASSNVSQCEDIVSRYGDRFTLYSGCDELVAPIYAVGGNGVISVVSNIFPAKMAELCKKWESGDEKTAVRLQLELYPLICALFSEVNPIPVKCAMAHLGLSDEEFRLPLCPMSEKNREIMTGEVDKLV